MKVRKKLHIAALVLAVIAALGVISSLGVSLPVPMVGTYALQGPTAANSAEGITSIIDSQSRRLLILDGDDAVSSAVTLDSADSPVDMARDTCVSGGYVYIVGLIYDQTGDLVCKESVLKYDTRGQLVDTVFELESDEENRHTILSICPAEHGIYAVVKHNVEDSSYDGRAVEIMELGDEGARVVKSIDAQAFSIRQISYNPVSGDYIGLNVLGALTEDGTMFAPNDLPDYAFTSLALDDAGVVYACDDMSSSVVKVSGKDVERLFGGEGFGRVNYSDGQIIASDIQGNEVIVCRTDGAGERTIGPVILPSRMLNVRATLVWLFAIYLAVLIAVLLIRRIISAVTNEKTNRLGAMLGSVVVVGVIAMAVGYLSVSAYQQMYDTRAREVNAFSDYLAATSSTVSEDIEAVGTRELFRASGEKLEQAIGAMAGIDEYMSALANAANANDIDLYFSVYAHDEHGVFCLYDSSLERVFGTSMTDENSRLAVEEAFTSKQAENTLYTGSTLRDATLYRLVSIPSSDGKELAGVVELGSRMKSLQASTATGQFQSVVALLVMMLVVYLTYTEMRAGVKCYLKHRKLLDVNIRDSVAVLARPLSFVVTMLQSVDAVMTVLIARELVGRMGMATDSVLVALPAVFLGLGMIVGEILYARLSSRVGLRKLATVAAGTMLVFALMTIPVVAYGALWMYCIAKFLMAAPFSLLYAICFALPRHAQSQEVQKRAGNGVTLTDTSAAALGTVLGGYVASVFGSPWVYLLVALVSIPVLFIAARLIPRGYRPLEDEKMDGTFLKNTAKLITNRTSVALALFLAFPIVLAGGYNSFLFPLYSADAGLTPASINNMFVLGQLVVYVLISFIAKTRTRYGDWKVGTLALALAGMVLLLLSLNQTIIWAVVAIALVGVFSKSANAWKAMWTLAADERGFPAAFGMATVLSTESVALIVRPIVLGTVLSVNQPLAVIIMGSVCVVCAVLFVLLTRNSCINESHRAQSSQSGA